MSVWDNWRVKELLNYDCIMSTLVFLYDDVASYNVGGV